jgi:hypothetical protein
MLAGGCRAEWDRDARERGDAVGHTGGVSPFAVEALAEGVRALTRDPARAAVFCDIDGRVSDRFFGRDARISFAVTLFLTW